MLHEIVEAKRAEVAGLRRNSARIRELAEARARGAGFLAALRAGSGVRVIAEVKRRSPSAGEIAADVAAGVRARVYEEAGAAAVSVLTDADFFGGSLSDLEEAAEAVAIPLLRKDFTIEAVQVYEARAAGASAVLLIARILDDSQLTDLGALADELGLSALVEVHDEREVERALKADARLVGVNNRDLSTFATDLSVTTRLSGYVPGDVVLVGESGIRAVADVERLAESGIDAVLVGGALMSAADPRELISAMSAVVRKAR